MRKIICFIFGIWIISACATHGSMPVPNEKKIYNPDIAVYYVNSGTVLDSLLKSEIQEDVPWDIHIMESTSPQSDSAIIYLTDQGRVPSFFIDAPPLIGYCRYQEHSCFIYGVSEKIDSNFENYLTCDSKRRMLIDSVPSYTISNSCAFKRCMLPRWQKRQGACSRTSQKTTSN